MLPRMHSAMERVSELPRVILALDVSTEDAALRLIDELAGMKCMYKIGLEAYCAGFGAGLARTLADRGVSVFADLKLLDIPSTVARAAAAVSECRPTYLTVHAQRPALEAAVAHAGDAGILAVTLLTSVDEADLRETGHVGSLEDFVVDKAKLAASAGCAGVVCSPNEAAAVRSVVGDRLRIVTPGIRPGNVVHGDQARVAGVADAFAGGADHIVVGRAVRDAPEPRKALEDILAQAGKS